MELNTRSWDAAEVLTDAESIFYYIESALESSTPEHVAGSLATAARARGGVEAFARETGVDASTLQQAVAQPNECTYQVAAKIMKAFRPSVTARVA